MKKFLIGLFAAAAGLVPAVSAWAQPAAEDDSKIGVVVMHGKSGSPGQHVAVFAEALTSRGLRVANLEMPWSGRRNYDRGVGGADAEVNQAIAALRAQGATRIFLAGHSLGAMYAFSFVNRFPVVGVVAIAPGHRPEVPNLRNMFASSVAEAGQLVAAGKGNEKARLLDSEANYNQGRPYPVVSPPAAYLDYFDPEGPMNGARNVRGVPASVPVLMIEPTNETPPLRQGMLQLFQQMPKHPLSRLYEPGSRHLDAPGASIDEALGWIRAVAGASPK